MNNTLHNRWLDEALDLLPLATESDIARRDPVYPGRHIGRAQIPGFLQRVNRYFVDNRSRAEDYLRPLLRECQAKSKSRFWMWLRLQLARMDDPELFLEFMRESRCPLEVVAAAEGFTYTVNGDVALIAVGDEARPAVWKVPVDKLEWALDQYPVTLKVLPPLESPNALKIRELKQSVRRMTWLTSAQRKEWLTQIAPLEQPEDNPVPRYSLTKMINGWTVDLHRIFVDANEFDVDAVDGDFLNYGLARVKVTVEPIVYDGWAIGRHGRPPETVTTLIEIPNLQIVDSRAQQALFEDSHLQVKVTRGDVETTLPIQPNSRWEAGCFGKIAEAGRFKPLTPEERLADGQGGIDRKWLTQ